MASIVFLPNSYTLNINLSLIETKALLNDSPIFVKFKGDCLEFRMASLNSEVPGFKYDSLNPNKILVFPKKTLEEFRDIKTCAGIYYLDERTCEIALYEIFLDNF